MSNEDNKILKYKHGEKSMKAPFIIYTDLELSEKTHSCQNSPEKSYTEKKPKNLSICLLVTHCLQIAHLAQQKADLVVTKVKIVLKNFVKT